jgi:hypothetical protein
MQLPAKTTSSIHQWIDLCSHRSTYLCTRNEGPLRALGTMCIGHVSLHPRHTTATYLTHRCGAPPGSSEADEIYKICTVMGTPTKQTWPEGLKLAANMNFRFPQCAAVPLSKLVQSACPDAIDLMTGLCAWCEPAPTSLVPVALLCFRAARGCLHSAEMEVLPLLLLHGCCCC